MKIATAFIFVIMLSFAAGYFARAALYKAELGKDYRDDLWWVAAALLDILGVLYIFSVLS